MMVWAMAGGPSSSAKMAKGGGRETVKGIFHSAQSAGFCILLEFSFLAILTKHGGPACQSGRLRQHSSVTSLCLKGAACSQYSRVWGLGLTPVCPPPCLTS